MNLYEITEKYRASIDCCADFDPETGEIINFDIDKFEGDLKDKRLAVAGYIKNLEAECDAMTQAAERICERANKKKNHIQRLKESLLCSMKATNDDFVEGSELSIKLKKNPPKLIVDNSLDLSADFFYTKQPEAVLDTALLKSALKDGKVIKGARLEQETRVEIK